MYSQPEDRRVTMCYVLCGAYSVFNQLLSCIRTILELALFQGRCATPREDSLILLWKGEYEIFFPFGLVPYLFIGMKDKLSLKCLNFFSSVLPCSSLLIWMCHLQHQSRMFLLNKDKLFLNLEIFFKSTNSCYLEGGNGEYLALRPAQPYFSMLK
jgi:hypothetical protein